MAKAQNPLKWNVELFYQLHLIVIILSLPRPSTYAEIYTLMRPINDEPLPWPYLLTYPTLGNAPIQWIHPA